MSRGRVIPLVGDTHRVVQEFLPWYASGRLDLADIVCVQSHLEVCLRCQAELDLERQLQAVYRTLVFDSDPQAGLQALHRRIARRQPLRQLKRRLGRLIDRWHAVSPWPRQLVAAQWVVIVVLLTTVVVQLEDTPRYRALGSPGTGSPANMVVLFRADAAEGALRQALRASGARIVGGPTASDAYLLSVPPTRLTAALASLRAESVVVDAQALGRGTQP